jgi:hypothetical protein
MLEKITVPQGLRENFRVPDPPQGRETMQTKFAAQSVFPLARAFGGTAAGRDEAVID